MLTVSGASSCVTDADCDDGVACTVDSYDVATHQCSNSPDDSACDDAVFCNGAEVCDVANGCTAGPLPCDDGVVCTMDVCDETNQTCTHTPDDTACDDGVFCNGPERCHPLLGCQAAAPPDCDDDNDCTDDACDVVTDACVHAALADDTTCEDGFFCTISDTCTGGVCVAGSVNLLCVGPQGPSGPSGPGGGGPPGPAGPRGLSCWDLNGNGMGDPEEDINGDGDFNALDCRGDSGDAGPTGPRGEPGLSCWDLNGDGTAEPDEDTNGDGNFDALDCQGPPGSGGRACAVGVGRRAGVEVGANHRFGDPPLAGGGKDLGRLGHGQGRDFRRWGGHISSSPAMGAQWGTFLVKRSNPALMPARVPGWMERPQRTCRQHQRMIRCRQPMVRRPQWTVRRHRRIIRGRQPMVRHREWTVYYQTP